MKMRRLFQKHMSKEERKQMYITYVLSKNKGLVDEEVLIKEASNKFDKENE